MIEILATLSASAAAGIRIGVPLLIIGLLHGSNFWSHIPVLSHISSPVLLGCLITYSLVELFASKKLWGQRILQVIQLLLSPLAGAIMGLAVVSATATPNWLIITIGSSLALVLQLVQVGWFYRLRGLPLWAVFLQDTLCVALVLFAFDAPWQGGVIALILLWFAVRSAKEWYEWYHNKA
ncbi:DUF4126 domain-containing protein [Anabaena sp. FACHB-709]|uniref:DUF4126 domain-containing protein n=2 Tax=Nostocaceae TaxID=1162 RepID=A0A1Z4KSD3_ANAVA|nr:MULTISPECIES: DUF4126 domain-containing protein [Nostocaceae]BAY71857.1 hypothetical protein NIES23_46800 [Trichormus variabilis NIES-23]HBW33766.1 DUF4126 domain-containing protein [Nostoc sp. UBA8866]MBD2172236.1 DUF4126 domain-containing protein [Anabaena cylindrica FACHB-318]MBD2263943.1 DUF4126 domain-containing protein [Anabaena sp. FACHB-709]MBD2273177.1 DUF4126 domain-containing protein [Nostoc sp. PCC 7120 = FACHB-418]